MTRNTWQQAQELENEYWLTRLNQNTISSESEFRFKILLKIAPPLSGNKTICDVGSGPNGGILPLIKTNSLKIAVDPMFKLVPISSYAFRKFTALKGVGEKLAFKDNSCDVIFNINSLDHSSVPREILNNMYKVLKSDGKLVMMVHVVSSQQKLTYNVFKFIRFGVKNKLIVSFSQRLIDFLSYKLFGISIASDSYLHPFYFTVKEFYSRAAKEKFNISFTMLVSSPFGFKNELFLILDPLKQTKNI